MGSILFVLELEIDKGLNSGTLNLNDYINSGGDHHGAECHPTPSQHLDECLLPSIGQEVRKVAKGYQCKHVAVTADHLREQFGMEIGEYLCEHGLRRLEIVVAKEYPAESHKMECKDHGGYALPTFALMVTFVVKHIGTQPLVYGQCCAMHATPSHEIQAGSVPETTQQHGHNQVDIGAYAASAVATQRDIDVVAYPGG